MKSQSSKKLKKEMKKENIEDIPNELPKHFPNTSNLFEEAFKKAGIKVENLKPKSK